MDATELCGMGKGGGRIIIVAVDLGQPVSLTLT